MNQSKWNWSATKSTLRFFLWSFSNDINTSVALAWARRDWERITDLSSMKCPCMCPRIKWSSIRDYATVRPELDTQNNNLEAEEIRLQIEHRYFSFRTRNCHLCDEHSSGHCPDLSRVSNAVDECWSKCVRWSDERSMVDIDVLQERGDESA